MPIKASSPTLALKAPVYRFRFAFGIGLLVSHAQQNPKSLTYSLVRILGSISILARATPLDSDGDPNKNTRWQLVFRELEWGCGRSAVVWPSLKGTMASLV